MSVVMPPEVGVRFSHAALQVIAADHGIDLLHIKGPAVDERLLERATGEDPDTGARLDHSVLRDSVDADVLVRPTQLTSLLKAMRMHGWRTAYRFEDGSAFEHASTMVHDHLAPVDLHRSFPGIGLEPEAAFEGLWAEHHTAPIGGYGCAVPSVTGQRLILLLHAARGGVAGNPDVQRCWTDATVEERREVENLARELRAEVALAAASGRLDDFRTAREHALWSALSNGETSMVKIWAARVRAAPTVAEGLRIAVRLVLPNPNRLEQQLGRPPTRSELAAAYARRARWGLGEVRRFMRRRASTKA